ncbi:hypothetical protein D3C76_1462110 [compost metagenome]
MAVHRYRIGSENVPCLIKRMYRHIEQQRTIHQITESAKVWTEEKVGSCVTYLPYSSAGNEVLVGADTRIETTILHDGLNVSCAASGLHNVCAFGEGLC